MEAFQCDSCYPRHLDGPEPEETIFYCISCLVSWPPPLPDPAAGPPLARPAQHLYPETQQQRQVPALPYFGQLGEHTAQPHGIPISWAAAALQPAPRHISRGNSGWNTPQPACQLA